jgi:protein-S-isoprenylcysteine O-methyltransferase Ste14
MNLKGFDKFREKTPAYSGKKIIVVPILALCAVTAAFSVHITFDKMPENLLGLSANPVLLSFLPLLGVVIVTCATFSLVWQMWLQRDRLKDRYGPMAYQRVFPLGIVGVVGVFTIALNQFLPYYSYAPGFWATSPLRVFATPLNLLAGPIGQALLIVRYALAAFLSVTGFLMCVRALQVFRMDNMTAVYLYFSEESRIQENEIYSALRHPAYAGALYIGLGGTFFTFTVFSFIAYLVFLGWFFIHIHFIEERELIQRFGYSYLDYRKKVPAFFVDPKKVGAFLRFLIRRS